MASGIDTSSASPSPALGHSTIELDGGLLDDIQLDSSFLHADLLGVPAIGVDELLSFDDHGSEMALPAGLPSGDVFNNDFSTGGGPTAMPDYLEFAMDDGYAVERASPSTSESGNRGPSSDDGGLRRKRTASSGQQTEKPKGAEDEAKRLARMQRNRENAFLSRQRKKQQMMDLQATVAQLKSHNTQLACTMQRLVAETCLLRHHLQVACAKAGMPVPQVPSALKYAPPQQQQGAAGAAHSVAAAGYTANAARQQHQTMQPVVHAAVGPAQQTRRQSQPASAMPENAALTAPAPAAPASISSSQPRKRARISGASAAFLALFSVFMFASPYYLPSGSVRQSMPAMPLAPSTVPSIAGLLPASSSVAQELRNGHARVLMEASFQEQQALEHDNIQEQRPYSLATTFNATLEALLEDPQARNAPAESLLRLQELAPAAVLLNRDTINEVADETPHAGKHSSTETSDPLAASVAFPSLASQFFHNAGLEGPQTCQKVFEFDAASLPHPQRSRRSVERYVTGTYGFKGRSAGLTLKQDMPPVRSAAVRGHNAPLMLPGPVRIPFPEQHSEERENQMPPGALVVKASTGIDFAGDAATQQHEKGPLQLHRGPFHTTGRNDGEDGEQHEGGAALPINVQEPTLVSVLLPANSSDRASPEGTGGLQAIDRVFVVVLYPQERFVTYSCGLSRPLLM